MSEQDIQARLAEVRRSYIASLRPRRQNIIELWESLQTQWDASEFEALHRLAHSLAGSAETFGFADITQAARLLVDDLRKLEEKPPSPPVRAQLDEKVRLVLLTLELHADGED